jgi:hypothetical protein
MAEEPSAKLWLNCWPTISSRILTLRGRRQPFYFVRKGKTAFVSSFEKSTRSQKRISFQFSESMSSCQCLPGRLTFPLSTPTNAFTRSNSRKRTGKKPLSELIAACTITTHAFWSENRTCSVPDVNGQLARPIQVADCTGQHPGYHHLQHERHVKKIDGVFPLVAKSGLTLSPKKCHLRINLSPRWVTPSAISG